MGKRGNTNILTTCSTKQKKSKNLEFAAGAPKTYSIKQLKHMAEP
jgi:hypothetical protein